MGGVQDLRADGAEQTNAPPSASIVLTWTPARLSSQYVCRDDTGGMFYPTRLVTLDKDVNTYTVEAPATVGSKYYFCIQADDYNDSGGKSSFFGNRVVVTAVAFTPATTPQNVALSSDMAMPGETVVMSWEASTAGNYGVIKGYEIARFTSAGLYVDTYTIVGPDVLQCNVPASTTGGEYYYYSVRAVAQYNAGNSAYCSPLALWSIKNPDAPKIRTGGTIYNPRPRILAKTGTGLTPLAVSANGYSASRNSGIDENQGLVFRKSSAAMDGESYTATIVITDSFGTSASANAKFTYTAPTWTDTPVVAGETRIKAVHINELRNAFDVICFYYNLRLTKWAETVEAGTTPSYNWPAHVKELQDTAQRIAEFINGFDTESAVNRVNLPSMPEPTLASAEIINQLREIVTML